MAEVFYYTKRGTEKEYLAQAHFRQYGDNMCFGSRRGLPIWGILFGAILILWGVTSLLGDIYWWASWDKLWPIIVIAFGLLILINALTRRR